MKVHGIEPADHLSALSIKFRRPIKPPQHIRTAIVDLDTVKVYGAIIRDVAIVAAIDTGRKHMHIMPCHGEVSAQSVHRINRPAVAMGRDVGRCDVENSHVLLKGSVV
jgi:hypothetical protein